MAASRVVIFVFALLLCQCLAFKRKANEAYNRL
jgi:hypothetical protein